AFFETLPENTLMRRQNLPATICVYHARAALGLLFSFLLLFFVRTRSADFCWLLHYRTLSQSLVIQEIPRNTSRILHCRRIFYLQCLAIDAIATIFAATEAFQVRFYLLLVLKSKFRW